MTAVPPTIILMSPMGGLGRSLSRRGFCSLLFDELLQLPLFNKGFNLLFQVVTIGRVMTVVSVEATILILRAFVGISLQLSEVSQGLLIFDLYQNLIYWGR